MYWPSSLTCYSIIVSCVRVCDVWLPRKASKENLKSRPSFFACSILSRMFNVTNEKCMLKIFRFLFPIFVFICFQFSVYLLTVLFSGCRIKCTGEASVAPTEGDFPVVCVMQHLKGLCILKQSQLLLNRISFLLLFYVPNPKVHWA